MCLEEIREQKIGARSLFYAFTRQKVTDYGLLVPDPLITDS